MMRTLLASVANIASGMGCEYKDSIPVWLNEIFAFSIFLCETLNYYLFFMYTIQVCDREKKWRRTLQWNGFWLAAEALARLVDEELGIESVHINLSVVQCLQPDMSEQFLQAVRQHNL